VAGTPVDRARKPSAAGDTGASWRVPSAVMDHVCVARRVPPTRYAQSAGAKIAFQVSGEGPCDLVFVPGLVSHLDLQWQQPSYRRFVTGLEHACRVIRFDKRGTGLSDPTDALPGMDERVADLAAVMDAAGSQAAVVFGVSDGGRGAIAFAAAHPARVLGLILYGTSYRGPRPGLLRQYRSIVGRWGEGRLLELVAPSLAGPGNRDFAGAFERAAASPRLARPGALGLLRPRECRDAMTGRNNDPSIDGTNDRCRSTGAALQFPHITDNLRVGDAIDRQHRLREYSAIWPTQTVGPVLSHVCLTASLITNDDADLCIGMHTRNSLTSADADVGWPSGLRLAARRSPGSRSTGRPPRRPRCPPRRRLGAAQRFMGMATERVRAGPVAQRPAISPVRCSRSARRCTAAHVR